MNGNNIDPKYICLICQEVFKNPVIIIGCNHNYCNTCLINYMINSEKEYSSSKEYQNNPYSTPKCKCPACRTEFTRENVQQNMILTNEIFTTVINCKCGQQIPLMNYNTHSINCAVINAEIQESIKNNLVKDAKQIINRDTFNCTVCNQKNFDRKGILNHVRTYHPSTYGVCPICVVQPWGDPNYKTHLKSHMELRHNFDYDTTVDYNEDEDAVLQRVLMESMNDK